MTEQGEPVKPPEEKTFLQKYWIYIALVMGAMRTLTLLISTNLLLTLLPLVIMPGPPEEGQGGGGGGGARR